MKIASFALLCGLLLSCQKDAPVAEVPQGPVTDKLKAEAQELRGLFTTELSQSFLEATNFLPEPSARTIMYNKAERKAYTLAQTATMNPHDLHGYEEEVLEPTFYYNTKYGTPLAFCRVVEILGSHGIEKFDGKKIADFGFGSIGQLRLMASLGAEAYGIDVDEMLETLYSEPGDTGKIQGKGKSGSVELLIGQYPAEQALVDRLGNGVDVFVSKNTLKNGYINPAEEVDPRLLIDLGVENEAFLEHVHSALRKDGLFLIYNLSPPQKKDRYIPWADGRSPFTKEQFEAAGFEVVVFDENDDQTARAMGKALGWDASMNLNTDLFALYTLVRKR
ncbi:MAG: hypothetical protein HKN21_00945 [Candidatus Eisenbacteria bacterium]|uniref:Class I SAM-dependent methyltransferase n=1 Tax=Eiseniibacteriota bacterium TaxID=2212470 RepID=A0A7Y2H159_UNCEI|nr:hypothetical protein [Candidatus Eisenbacteria bacterium]